MVANREKLMVKVFRIDYDRFYENSINISTFKKLSQVENDFNPQPNFLFIG